MIKNRFKTIENYFFILIVILNLFPVLSGKFFPTMDGATHLYNSNIINNLLFNHNTSLTDFFIFNSQPVPNWTGHFILSVFNLFLPAFIAEKILLVLYLISLPLFFRSLIKTISPDNYLLSYIIFPFTYSFLFVLGFYNFSLGIVFMFITLNFLIKNEINLGSAKILFQLFCLFTITYFSHIFIFILLLILIAIWLATKLIVDIINQTFPIKQIIIIYIKKAGAIAIASFLPLLLFAFYFYSRPYHIETGTFVNQSELISWLKNIRPIIAYSFIEEEIYTKKLAYLTFSIIIIVIYNRICRLKYISSLSVKSNILLALKNGINYSDCWLFSSILILFLYFKLPDSDNSAGYVSIRLGLLFFMILFLWLSSQKISNKFSVIAIGIILYCNFNLNYYYTSVIKGLNRTAIECNNISSYILPNSIVIPLNYSDHWLYGHFSNYLGIDKPMIILENYECGVGYFPIKWNDKSFPNTLLGMLGSNQLSCAHWKSNNQNLPVQADYVFILGNMDSKSDSCTNLIKENILANYSLVCQTNNCKLYQINNKKISSPNIDD